MNKDRKFELITLVDLSGSLDARAELCPDYELLLMLESDDGVGAVPECTSPKVNSLLAFAKPPIIATSTFTQAITTACICLVDIQIWPSLIALIFTLIFRCLLGIVSEWGCSPLSSGLALASSSSTLRLLQWDCFGTASPVLPSPGQVPGSVTARSIFL
jgi:hypothetical protein